MTRAANTVEPECIRCKEMEINILVRKTTNKTLKSIQKHMTCDPAVAQANVLTV